MIISMYSFSRGLACLGFLARWKLLWGHWWKWWESSWHQCRCLCWRRTCLISFLQWDYQLTFSALHNSSALTSSRRGGGLRRWPGGPITSQYSGHVICLSSIHLEDEREDEKTDNDNEGRPVGKLSGAGSPWRRGKPRPWNPFNQSEKIRTKCILCHLCDRFEVADFV